VHRDEQIKIGEQITPSVLPLTKEISRITLAIKSASLSQGQMRERRYSLHCEPQPHTYEQYKSNIIIIIIALYLVFHKYKNITINSIKISAENT